MTIVSTSLPLLNKAVAVGLVIAIAAGWIAIGGA